MIECNIFFVCVKDFLNLSSQIVRTKLIIKIRVYQNFLIFIMLRLQDLKKYYWANPLYLISRSAH